MKTDDFDDAVSKVAQFCRADGSLIAARVPSDLRKGEDPAEYQSYRIDLDPH